MNTNMLLSAIVLLLTACSTPAVVEEPLDMYIVNAQILDGTGGKSYQGHLGIRDGRIVYVSQNPYNVSEATQVLDVKGAYVSPGFIDLHAHGNPMNTPDFNNFLAMGVTSIVLGQDGSSPVDELEGWKNFVDSAGTGVNVAMFLGHGALREKVAGYAPALTREQISEMENLFQQYSHIVFGLSTGLEYSPGLYADNDELRIMAERIGKNNRMIMSHMRNEDDTAVISSIKELAMQGEYCKVHIAHLKSVYGKGVDRAEEILGELHSLRNQGIDITADLYPYTASYTGISILFPEWSKTTEQFEEVRERRLPELKEFLRRKIEARNGPSATLLGTGKFTGKTLEELSIEYGMAPEDFLINEVGPQGASGAYFVMDEALQQRILQDSMVAICSDGSPTGFHPRGHGTFARVLERYVVANKALPLEEAIRKMTSFPASILGLSDRGIIQAGAKADLVVFNLEEVHENATFSNPLQLAEGFSYVLVNGEIAFDTNQQGTRNAGQFLVP